MTGPSKTWWHLIFPIAFIYTKLLCKAGSYTSQGNFERSTVKFSIAHEFVFGNTNLCDFAQDKSTSSSFLKRNLGKWPKLNKHAARLTWIVGSRHVGRRPHSEPCYILRQHGAAAEGNPHWSSVGEGRLDGHGTVPFRFPEGEGNFWKRHPLKFFKHPAKSQACLRYYMPISNTPFALVYV